MKKRNATITKRIIIFVLGVTFMFLAQHRCVVKIEELLQNEIFNIYNQTNEKLAVGVEKNIANIFKNMKQSANDVSIMMKEGVDPQEIVYEIDDYKNSINSKCVNFLTPGGLTYCSEDVPYDFSQSVYYPRVIANTEFISDPYYDYTYSDEQLVLFSQRINDANGKYEGAIVLNFRLSDISQYFALNQYNDKLETSFIIDKYFNVLFEPTSERTAEYKRVIDALEKSVKDDLMSFENNKTQFHITDDKDLVIVTPINTNETVKNIYAITVVNSAAYMSKVDTAHGHILKMLSLTFLTSAILLAYMLALLIRKSKNEETILRNMAFTDIETGVPNIQYFNHVLSNRKDEKGYVVALDMEHFTTIESLYSNKKVIEIIKGMYETIKGVLGENDVLAHDSRDQYALYIDINDRKFLEDKLVEINEALHNYSQTNNYPEIKSAFGISKFRKDETVSYTYAESQSVIKRKGIDKTKLFRYVEDAYQDDESIKKQIANEFHNLLENKKFYLDYQPIFDAQTGRVTSAEAFIRYKDDQNNVVYPDEFIRSLEASGFIHELDSYVFMTIVDFIKNQLEQNKNIVPITMNISRYTLYQKDICDNFFNYAKQKGVDPKWVPLEIKDESIENDGRLKEIINDLQAKGFKIQIDHFGVGGYSLVSLSRVNFDVVKLDKSIIESIGDPRAEYVMRHLITLGKELGIDVVAFGVTNERQAEFVKNLGVLSIQGPYYSAPINELDFNYILDHYYEKRLFENIRYDILTRNAMVQTFESPTFSDEAISAMVGAIIKVGIKDDELYLMGSNTNAEALLHLDHKYLSHLPSYISFKDIAYDDDYYNLKELVNEAYTTSKSVSGKLLLRQEESMLPVICNVFAKNVLYGYKEAYVFISQEKDEVVDSEFVNHIPGGVLIYRPNDNQQIVKINDEILRITGYENEEEFFKSNNKTLREFVYIQDYHVVINSLFVQFFANDEKQANVKFRIQKADGKLIYISMQAKYQINDIYGDLIYCYIKSLEGQNESLLNEENKVERLRYESTHDGLTGLYNQASVKELANELFKNNPNEEFALLVMDIDDFKQFNDKHGHAFGDTVIKTFASTLKSCISRPGFCARVGGDEFVAIEPQSKETLEQIAERVYRKLHFTIGDSVVTPSIGVTCTNITERSYEEMFLNADISIYASKNAGKDTYTIYSPKDSHDGVYRKEENRIDTFDVSRVVQSVNAISEMNGSSMFVLDLRAHKFYVTDSVVKMFNFKENVADTSYMENNVIFESDVDLVKTEIAALRDGIKDKHEVVYRWLDKSRNPVWIKCHGRIIKNNEKALCLIGDIELINK